MSKPDGGPAFPAVPFVNTDHSVERGGMSLRDWFAGQALAALLSAPGDIGEQARRSDSVAVAEWAYDHADAMLEARGSE